MRHAPSAETGRRAGWREWTGLGVLILPTLLVALDIGVLFLALPHLSADLGASGTQQLWITDVYGFMVAGFLITMGTLGDRVGRRRLLLIGAAAFTAASVMAAYSTSAEMLIVARALLGVAGATLAPSTLALISNMFSDERQRGVAISFWATSQFGGAALGPVVGGLMLEHFWWGSVFLLGVPVMCLLLVAGPLLLPEYRSPTAGRLDLASVALSLATVLPVVYGIKELAAGDAGTSAAGAIAVGLALGVVFVRRQFRLEDPLLNLSLFALPAIRAALPAMMIASAALAGTGLLSTQYIQSVIRLAPGEAGLWQAPTGLGIAAGTLLAPLVVRRLKPVTTMVAGLSLSALALLLLVQAGADSLVPVVVGAAIAAFGVGPLFVLGTGLVVGSAPPEKAGSAASLSETSNMFGSTLGLAVLGSVGAAVYRQQMTAPDAARENIATATAMAERLPPEAGDDLLRAAGEAFTTAVNSVAVIGVVLFLTLAVLLRLALRRDATGV
ncbi:MFS transporter [Nonomuraea cavernae]|uniref:MFS transporter n=1 Tax=Nonomuraea cavernae TaxID=2045107 RepID=A0A918DQ04_9ACTN|nr:MFS transporter [Nonomuraea cavernae]MCA2186366.1 MFS transporter [Nonomuraea cavernae]GGO79346.1 MFS transporter [Nonomuraea cavernae]